MSAKLNAIGITFKVEILIFCHEFIQPTLLHTTLKNDVSFMGMRRLELHFLLIILIS